jgi:hypothetical protein
VDGEKRETPDLRARILAAAHDILRDESPERKLELRKIAEQAELSRTAPYLAFGQQQDGGGLAALQAALSADGFRRLAEAMREAAKANAEHPEQGLRAIAAAYLAFAEANPRLFRLMFGAEVAGKLHLEGLGEARRRALEVIEDAIRLCQNAGIVKPGDPARFGRTAWAAIHGHATLALDERAGSGSQAAEPEEVAEMAADHLLDGLKYSEPG